MRIRESIVVKVTVTIEGQGGGMMGGGDVPKTPQKAVM